MALQWRPDFAQSYNNLGLARLKQGKIDEAASNYKKALELDPKMAEAHFNLGVARVAQGKTAQGIDHLQKALVLRGGQDSEIGSVQQELAARPDDPVLRFKMGRIYLGQGKLDKAIKEFEKAMALQPNFLAARNNLAMALAADGQYDRAQAAFKKLIALDPDNAGNYYNVAVLYALQNNVPESITWLKQAVAKGYQNWELIKTDKDLANIRDSEEYKQMVEGR